MRLNSEMCAALPVLVRLERVAHFAAEIPLGKTVSKMVGDNSESEDDVLELGQHERHGTAMAWEPPDLKDDYPAALELVAILSRLQLPRSPRACGGASIRGPLTGNSGPSVKGCHRAGGNVRDQQGVLFQIPDSQEVERYALRDLPVLNS